MPALATVADAYLSATLAKYAVRDAPVRQAAASLAPALRHWAGRHYREHQLSGSFAKGTATSLGADLDIFISLGHSAGPTMKAIYLGLLDYCAARGLRPRPQNVSIRIHTAGLKIDLVPGRIHPGHTNDHSLYRSKLDSWVQTNVATYVRLIAASGRTAEIRALKIWRERNTLSFPSFYLELAVLDALRTRPTHALAENVRAALAYLADGFQHARVVDPANSNNVISSDLGPEHKRVIAAVAAKSLATSSFERIIW
jgi:hypothetical protein